MVDKPLHRKTVALQTLLKAEENWGAREGLSVHIPPLIAIHWGKADDRSCNYGHPKMADVESGKQNFVN
jgi:hypothetical protein